MHWGDMAKTRTEQFGPLVLGIDPADDHAPEALLSAPKRFLERYTEVLLDAAEGEVGFVKFQSAYFEAFGSAGVTSLARAIASARERGFAVILDAKRGDIGSTADAYARSYAILESAIPPACKGLFPQPGRRSGPAARCRIGRARLLPASPASRSLSGLGQEGCPRQTCHRRITGPKPLRHQGTQDERGQRTGEA